MSPPDRAAGSAETADLTDAIRRLARTSVLVVGDAMLDRFVYGAVTRVSSEAPIPILTVERDVAMPGGAGNVVRNLTALGAAVAFVSVVGDDQAGSDLTGLIGGQPNVEPWLLVQGARTTTTKTRYVAQGQQLLRADHEIVAPIHPKLAERLLRITQDALTATTVTVLSDYNKGVLSGTLPAQIIAAAKAANRRTVVDPKGRDYARYAGADVITPSRRELAEATGLPVDTEQAVTDAARALIAAHGFGAVVVTQAEDGMSLVTAAGAVHHFPAEAAEVYDVSGAGDTVVATLAAGLAAGLELPVAVRLANVAAGVVVGKVGTAVPRPSDLLAALSPARRGAAQGGHARAGDRAGGAVAAAGPEDGFHRRRLRPAGPGPHPSAGTGTQRVRPAGGRPALRRQPAAGGQPAARRAVRGGAGGDAGQRDRRGPGLRVRRGHGPGNVARATPRPFGPGRGRHGDHGCRRRVRAELRRTGGRTRKPARPGCHRTGATPSYCVTIRPLV